MDNNQKEALLKLLDDPEAVEFLYERSQDVNNKIIGGDEIRRRQPAEKIEQVISTDELKPTNLVTNGGQQVNVTARTLEAIANNIIQSDAMQIMISTVARMQQEYKQKMTDLENQVLKLNQRVGNVERSQDERLSEKIAEMPANTVLTLDIPDGFSTTATRYKAQPMSEQQRGGVQTIHEVNGLFQKMRKDLKIGGE